MIFLDRILPIFITLYVFLAGQDVDLRSLDMRNNDPRMNRIVDQDMRTLPGQMVNPLPVANDRWVIGVLVLVWLQSFLRSLQFLVDMDSR